MRDAAGEVRVVVTLPNGSIEFTAADDRTADMLTGWLEPHVPDTAEWPVSAPVGSAVRVPWDGATVDGIVHEVAGALTWVSVPRTRRARTARCLVPFPTENLRPVVAREWPDPHGPLTTEHRHPMPKRAMARPEAIALLTEIVRSAIAMPWEDPATAGAEDVADAAYRLAWLLGLDRLPNGSDEDPVFA